MADPRAAVVQFPQQAQNPPAPAQVQQAQNPPAPVQVQLAQDPPAPAQVQQAQNPPAPVQVQQGQNPPARTQGQAQGNLALSTKEKLEKKYDEMKADMDTLSCASVDSLLTKIKKLASCPI